MNTQNPYALTPLKKPAPAVPFGVIDIEGRKWIEFLTLGFYGPHYSCSKHRPASARKGGQSPGLSSPDFFHFEDIHAALDWLFAHGPDCIFAHFGGIYDFLFILDAALRSKEYTLESLIPRGSGILCFTLRNSVRGITFRDSSALFPFALKTLTESFGVSHKKKEWDHTKTTQVTPDLIEYLKYDCVGLYEVINRFYNVSAIKRVGPKFTVASQALQVFRGTLRDPVPSCSTSADIFVRRSYAGGRVEIFKPIYSNRAPLYLYDVNSLYPFVMRDAEMPGAFLGCSERYDAEKMGFIDCEVHVPKETRLPLLWVKSPKFIFPTGNLRGVWSMLEIAMAVSAGVKITRVHKCAYFESAGPIFKSYVTEMYALRKSAQSEAENIAAKYLLNSLYGRMGLNLSKDGLEQDMGQPDVIPHFEIRLGRESIRFCKVKTQLRSFSNVAIAAWITALARIHMHKLLASDIENCLYTDTDSLFTTSVLPTGSELGELKLEKTWLYPDNKACFLLPKTYFAGDKIAMKGFDKKKIKHFTFEDFKASLEGELRLKTHTEPRMNRFKTAMSHGKFLHLGKNTTKQIRSKYDKRVFDPKTGKFIPIHLE